MADALVSGASVRKDVEVQLLSAAPAMRPLFSSRDRRHGVGIATRSARSCGGSRAHPEVRMAIPLSSVCLPRDQIPREEICAPVDSPPRERPTLGRATAMWLCMRFCWVAYLSGVGDYLGVCDSRFSHQLAALTRTRTADRDRRPDPYRRPSGVRICTPGPRDRIQHGPRLGERVREERSPAALAPARSLARTAGRAPLADTGSAWE
jgi:hypothetical protein